MLRNPDRMRRFEGDEGRRAYRDLSYLDALAIFEALLEEARALRPDFGEDWEEDLAPDLAVARALNGLPPVAA